MPNNLFLNKVGSGRRKLQKQQEAFFNNMPLTVLNIIKCLTVFIIESFL